jgi:hypothetical protein
MDEDFGRVKRLRERLRDGFATFEEYAAAHHICMRSVYVQVSRGLPVCQIAGVKLIPVDRAREWLLQNEVTRGGPPRKAGRPRMQRETETV